MSGHGSDDGPLGGRRPAPRRPDTGSSRRPAPPPVEHDDDDSDEKTQALNLDDLARFGAADDATVSMSAAELRARVGQRSQLPPEPEHEESEATVAMQIPGDLMDGGGAKKTILGHPGLARGASSAVRGAAPVKRNETLAMDSRNVRAAAAAAKAAAGDADESTQAMDVNAMLAGIDDGGGGDEATQAMNMDDMLSRIDSDRAAASRPAPARSAPPPARPAPAFEHEESEATQAVDMDQMLSSLGDEDDENAPTQALNLEDLQREYGATPAKRQAPAPARPEPARAPVAAPAPAPAAAAAAGAPIAGLGAVAPLPPAPDKDSLVGGMAYAITFPGRSEQIASGLAQLDAEIAAGTAPPNARQLRQQYEAERAALDPAAAKAGWTKIGIFGGGVAAVMILLGLLL